MLRNAYLLAKIGADTAESERNVPKMRLKAQRTRGRRQRVRRRRGGPRGHGRAPGGHGGGLGERGGDRAPWTWAVLCVRWQNWQILQFFGGLVLGCIKTKFCKKICV